MAAVKLMADDSNIGSRVPATASTCRGGDAASIRHRFGTDPRDQLADCDGTPFGTRVSSIPAASAA